MCLICIELDRQARTSREARRALGEMRAGLEPAHLAEDDSKVEDAERDEKDREPSTSPPGGRTP